MCRVVVSVDPASKVVSIVIGIVGSWSVEGRGDGNTVLLYSSEKIFRRTTSTSSSSLSTYHLPFDVPPPPFRRIRRTMSINGALSTPLVSSSAFTSIDSARPSRASTTSSEPTADVPERNKLGTVNGVIIPCLLNIFGAILFVRLPWAVGQTGWLGVILQFILGGTLVTLTTLSIAAISTNGLVRGGGAYYMLSRSLGPEFGAAVGITYYFAASISVAFYLIAFAENMVECIKGTATDLPFAFPLGEYGLQTSIASVTLLLLLAQAQIGAGFVAKANSFIFVILCVSIVLASISFITGGGHDEAYLSTFGYTGMSWNTLLSNTWKSPDTRECVCRIAPQQCHISYILCVYMLFDTLSCSKCN